jgi:hypothetical protein
MLSPVGGTGALAAEVWLPKAPIVQLLPALLIGVRVFPALVSFKSDDRFPTVIFDKLVPLPMSRTGLNNAQTAYTEGTAKISQ